MTMLKRLKLPLFSLLALAALLLVSFNTAAAAGVAQAGEQGALPNGGAPPNCHGEANCAGWVFYFGHMLMEEATVTVYARLANQWVEVGSGVAGPSDGPVILTGDYTQPLPAEETRIAFVVEYMGQSGVVQTMKPACQNCTSTQGYWKNHAENWPVLALVLGDSAYSKSQLLDILNTPTDGDATYILAHQLIAAKLNVAKGADDSAIAATIAAADAWLIQNPLGSNPQGDARQEGIDLAATLDDYNNGLIGPGSCD